MSEKRKDNKGRILRTGESQRKDGRYQYRFQNRLGERKVIYALSLNELREREKNLAKDLDENINTERANMTLNELFDLFMGLKSNIKNTTRTNYLGLWKSNVRNSYVGNMKLPDIRKIDIMKLYASYQEKGLSINSIKYIDVIISQTLMFAVDSDIIRKNPARNCIKEFSGDENVKYSLTQEQQKKFVDYISSSRVYAIHLPMILYMLNTACRIGEVAGVSWSKNINLDERIITIDHQLIYKNLDGSTRFHITSPKSSSGKREIPITDEILRVLMMQKENDISTGSFCKVSIDDYDDFVFTTRHGTPLSPAHVNSILVNIVNAYNKAESKKAEEEKRDACLLPHISSHILRHTACTRMAEAGFDVKILQYVMGHSDINTTMNIYNHIDSVRVRGEMDKLNGTMMEMV
ncbi:site-specific integrase [Enterocloster clostridioformis]|uniref:Site-specific recombinase XerD n=1 Tax=Enterocloster clostridioformis TaxID=1531 RepID=A0A1I0CRT8_9FIRM|nr:site-specific integrase [Enterocloster clostridioformis]SET22262.1 Site-specific recombinase XerD [Enterocloster clostridioformis]SEV94338.1 Site-specific recombinase XerD [Enterocloster clostridioformis]